MYLVLSFQASSLSFEAALSTSMGMAQKRIRSPRVVPLGSVIPLHQPWGGMCRRCLPRRNHPEPFSPKSWLSPVWFPCCAAPWVDFFFQVHPQAGRCSENALGGGCWGWRAAFWSSRWRNQEGFLRQMSELSVSFPQSHPARLLLFLSLLQER